MNTRTRTLITAVALAGAAAALNSQAADQDAFFAQQRQLDDGGFPQYNVVPTQSRLKPATPHQVAESKWFDAERARASGAPPVPFPVPAPAASKRVLAPQTPYQAAENDWLTKERELSDGSTAPIPFVAPAANANVAGR